MSRKPRTNPENNNSNNPGLGNQEPTQGIVAAARAARKAVAAPVAPKSATPQSTKQDVQNKASKLASMIAETTNDDTSYFNAGMLAMMKETKNKKGKNHIELFLDAINSGGVKDGQKFVDMMETVINYCLLKDAFSLVEFAVFLEFTNSMEIKDAKGRYDDNMKKAGEFGTAAPMKRQTGGLPTFQKVASALIDGVSKTKLDEKCLTWGSILQTTFVVFAMQDIHKSINIVSSKVAKWFHNKAFWKSMEYKALLDLFLERWFVVEEFLQYGLDNGWFRLMPAGTTTNTGFKSQVAFLKLSDDQRTRIQLTEDEPEGVAETWTVSDYMEGASVELTPKRYLHAGMVPNFRGLGMCSTIRQDKSNVAITQAIAETQGTYITFVDGDLDDITDWDLNYLSDFSQKYFKCFKFLSLSWRECTRDVFGGNGGADTRTGKMKFKKIEQKASDKKAGIMGRFTAM